MRAPGHLGCVPLSLLLLLLLLLLESHAVPAKHEACRGKQGIKLKQCCVVAYNDVMKKAETQALAIANATAQGVIGDALYTDLMYSCMQQKQALRTTGPCRESLQHVGLSAARCTKSPFTDDYNLYKKGLLQVQERARQSTIKSCRQQRFLLWTRNEDDFSAGHNHKLFSMSCAFWEAYSLNRTLVLDSFVGMSNMHTQSELNAEVPFEAWYTRRADALPGGTVLYHEFARECGAPGVLQEANEDLAIMPSGALHSEMAAKAHVPLLVRSWDQGLQPAEKYGYHICRHRSAAAQSESGVDYTLPAGLCRHAYAPWVDRMTARVWAELQKRAALNAREDALVVCLHVRRGDKLSYTKYPNLNYETSPEGILKTIEPHVPHGSVLYLATNEPDPVAYFEPLRKHYDVVSLAHFAQLLSTDLYLLSSLGLVDYEIMGKCQRTIPTFASEIAKGFRQHISLSTSSKQR